MPQVPTVDAPSVSQSGAPIGVSAPASAFGASVIAAGLGELGATEQQTSDMLQKHAEQYQAINNKAEADGAFVSHLDAVNKYAADYQANNRGMKAVDNLPTALEDLNKQRTDIGETLSNPTARAMFDADSRRATANITGELTRFAAGQRKEYVLKQSAAVQEALASDTVIHPENFAANMRQMMEQQVAINEQLGLSPELGQLEARKLYGNTVAMVSETLAGTGNIEGASAFLQAHKEGMDGKVYADTLMKLKPAMLANDAADLGHEAVTDALHGMGSAIGPSVDYLSNVHGREGEAKNPHSTADGIGQFTQGTWLKMMKTDPQFAEDVKGKTDAQILQMRHDPSVANRGILAYAQSNADYLHSKGLPVNAATVGLAHGYGPGGAESLMHADPNAKVETVIGKQVAQNNGVLGQTVGAVIGKFQSRFGTGSVDSAAGGPPTSMDLQGRMQTVLALVDQKVAAKYGDNAVIRDQAEARAMSELNRQITAAKDKETSAFTTLGQVAMDSQIQDLPTLLKTVPNGLQMYNTLPLSQRTSLQSAVHHNATEITGSREQNIVALNGMWGSRTENPQAFLNAPIADMDLPLSQKIDFLKKQAELRGKPAAADPQAKQLAQITRMPEYKALIGSSGLNIKAGSDEEYTLRGSIAGQLEQWYTQHPTEPPKTKDIQAMIARSAGQHSYHYELFGQKIGSSFTEQEVPDISDADKEGISRQLTKLGIPISAFTIAKFYQQHAQGGQ
jgi:hypothetical protein